jgi:protein-tyrosine-phosphatase
VFEISGHRSKSVDAFASRTFDYVLTVCDQAKESCPIYPATATGYITVLKTQRQRAGRTKTN